MDKPFDIFCPLMGDPNEPRNNYWQERCLIRQQSPAVKQCKPGCRGLIKVAPKPTPVPTHRQHRQPLTKQKINKIYELVDAGRLYREVGHMLNINKSTVSKYIKLRRQT